MHEFIMRKDEDTLDVVALVVAWTKDPFLRIKKKAGSPTMQLESMHQTLEMQEEEEEDHEEDVPLLHQR